MPSQITLTNLISNGGLETNSAGWTGSHTLTRIVLPSALPSGEPGSQCGQVSGSVNGAIYAQLSSAIAVAPGRKYYIRAQVRHSSSGYANICGVMNNATPVSPSIATPVMTVNTWNLLDGIWTANSASLQLRLNYTGGSGNQSRTVQFDNVMVIDLTSDYGSGNEPALEDMRATVADGGYFWDGAKSVTVSDPLVITTASLPAGKKDAPYPSTTIQVTGGTLPFTFSATGLPAGMTCSGAGVISGDPTEDGYSNVFITVTDSAQRQAGKLFQILIGVAPVITTQSLDSGVIGVPYSQTIQVTGNTPFSFSMSSLPTGLNISDQGGGRFYIYGTPAATFHSSFTFTVSNTFGADTKIYLFEIEEPEPEHITFLQGKQAANLFVGGKEVLEAYVGGMLVYKLNIITSNK